MSNNHGYNVHEINKHGYLCSNDDRVSTHENWPDPLDKISMATILEEDLEDRSQWMAEPLTDRVRF